MVPSIGVVYVINDDAHEFKVSIKMTKAKEPEQKQSTMFCLFATTRNRINQLPFFLVQYIELQLGSFPSKASCKYTVSTHLKTFSLDLISCRFALMIHVVKKGHEDMMISPEVAYLLEGVCNGTACLENWG